MRLQSAVPDACVLALELPLNAQHMARMNLLHKLFAPRPDPREIMRPLWIAIVAEARRPEWYVRGGVEDSVTGRFDMVSSVLALVVLRMEQVGDLAREIALLTELYVADMDAQLREFGVGDVVVGKRVGKLMGATGGRIKAYRSGLGGDEDAMREAVLRNVTLREGSDPAVVAAGLRSLSERLGATTDDALLAGELAP